RRQSHHPAGQNEAVVRLPQPVPEIVPAERFPRDKDRETADAVSLATRPAEADLSAIRTIPVARRSNKVSAAEVAHAPAGDRSFGAFLHALPDVLVARDFRAVVSAIADASHRRRSVVVMLGGHVVKTGLSPLIIDLLHRGVVTHV